MKKTYIYILSAVAIVSALVITLNVINPVYGCSECSEMAQDIGASIESSPSDWTVEEYKYKESLFNFIPSVSPDTISNKQCGVRVTIDKQDLPYLTENIQSLSAFLIYNNDTIELNQADREYICKVYWDEIGKPKFEARHREISAQIDVIERKLDSLYLASVKHINIKCATN